MGGLSLSSFVEDTQYLLSVDFVQSSLIAVSYKHLTLPTTPYV